MAGWLVLLIATPLLIAASLAGGLLPGAIRATHLRMQLALSFVSGLMLGVAILHLLPHSVIMLGSVDRAAVLMLLGVVGVFLLMRFLHVHSVEPGIKLPVACEHVHEHEHGHDHEHGHGHHAPSTARERVRWMTLLSGLSLHSIVDGAALASAVRLELGQAWPGLLVLVVVVLHKPLDALAISATIGSDPVRRRRINLLYALVAPAAAWAAYLGFSSAGHLGAEIAGVAMAFCAGAFICVALADLMPEVQFHSHHRAVLTIALAFGVGVAMLLGYIEGHNHGLHDGHDHGESEGIQPPAHDHDHSH